MNVVEKAKDLAEAIKNTEEYTNYRKLKDELNSNEDLRGPFSLFEAKQMNLQRSQMLGETLNEDEIKDAQELYQELNENEIAKKYFEAEFKLNQMMSEVSKILGDAMNFS